MEEKTVEMFMYTVERINRYLILMGIFFFVYFLLVTKTDKFLFLLALSNMAFALLSHKLLCIVKGLASELRQSRTVLKEYAKKFGEESNPSIAA